jgi:putative secretion ATPase (PEP-CTERM system associated)
MYCSFYGIKEKPFSITPDPKYLFLGKTHKEAFAHLIYGIRERGGFIVVTGDIGTGKTTLCRALLSHLDANTLVAFVFNPTLSALELLKSINEDFGIRSDGNTQKELIDELNRFLLEKRREGKNTVLIIDEAQNLQQEVLEHIRLLSNLETDTEKLLQIILIGQPEFREMLEQPGLLQLNQRVTVRYHLRPLTREETESYVSHRLSVAGAEEKIRFSPKALRKISRYTRGVPRLINVLCDRALLAGYTLHTREIDGRMIEQAYREVTGEARPGAVGRMLVLLQRGWVPALLLALFVVVAVYGASILLNGNDLGDLVARKLGRSSSGLANGQGSPRLATTSESRGGAQQTGPGKAEPAGPDATAAASAAGPSAPGSLVGQAGSAGQGEGAPLGAGPVAPGASVSDAAGLGGPAVPAQAGPDGPSAANAGGAGGLGLDSSRSPGADGAAAVAAGSGVVPETEPFATIPGVVSQASASGAESPQSGPRSEAPVGESETAKLETAAGPADLATIRVDDSDQQQMGAAGQDLEALRKIFVLSLAGLTPSESLDRSFRAAIERWRAGSEGANAFPKEARVSDIFKAAERSGLRCYRLNGNFNRLRVLDVPAILDLNLGDRFGRRYVALLALDGADAEIAPSLQDGSVRVSASLLEEFWYGTAYVLWKDWAGGQGVVGPGSGGEAVDWLQSALQSLGYHTAKSTGMFDTQTAQAVRGFQRDHNLEEDGLLGPQTKICLFQALKQYEMPRLGIQEDDQEGAQP